MAADNRNFADVLDIQGTEVCLSDKKLAETSSETGVQTTDYVLLQDTDGAYHKILKSNFTEAIRNTLAGLLVNNDKGTSVNQIPAIASGDLGSVTPANLASVLGESKVEDLASGADLDTKITVGRYSCPYNDTAAALVHCPTNMAFSMYVFRTLSISQLIATHTNELWYRSKSSDGSWHSWERVDNYGTTSLAELASALGVRGEYRWSDYNSAQGAVFKLGSFVKSDHPLILLISEYVTSGTQETYMVNLNIRTNDQASISAKVVQKTGSDGSNVELGYDSSRNFYIRRSNGVTLGSVIQLMGSGFTFDVQKVDSSTSFTTITIEGR